MLNDMLAYSMGMLDAVTSALGSPPLIYLFGFILLVIIFKIFLLFLPKS